MWYGYHCLLSLLSLVYFLTSEFVLLFFEICFPVLHFCADPFIIRAESYQEYMKQIPIPSLRGSVVPFNSWTELGMSLKELYKQPLHYLTNIHLRRLDQIRIGSSDEDVPLDTIFLPSKAEASIWLMEEVHRISTSPSYLAELWRNDPFYHIFVDSMSPNLPQKSSR